MTHPYASKPEYCFWRRAVSTVARREVDPVVKGRFRIGAQDKVATAGSCFAQHIARHLARSGFAYFVTETAHPFLDAQIAARYNYGTFSARYGNIYVARQFLQLLHRAYGAFRPVDDIWRAENGCFIDPFRPQIQHGGFASEREYWLDREKHFQAVRRIVEEADILVFTLGLTEGWENIDDGAVYPLCPGTASGEFEPARHRLKNYRMGEVLQDISAAFDFIRARNASIRFIVTVSPVPLVATAEDRHVLVSTTYSKSVLRTVCGELESTRNDLAYFPSYEIITGNYSRGCYYGPDLREVTKGGVNHVMRLFMKHYAVERPRAALKQAQLRRVPSTPNFAARMAKVAEAICDEIVLDQ